MYSPNNSGIHRVGDTGDEAIETDTGFSGFIETEAAGPSIYIKQGNEVQVYPRPNANEAPGTFITVTLHGYRIAQRVTLGAATNVGRLRYRWAAWVLLVTISGWASIQTAAVA